MTFEWTLPRVCYADAGNNIFDLKNGALNLRIAVHFWFLNPVTIKTLSVFNNLLF